ncbi:hypothetical protein D623_10032522 [Myotis brandtii]|uniref:Uncharacterized protein n=1 Tax=Myotis brandtii TaxID=109478 RepID=S7MSA9_MYOBR|nr:hypothetical protein D623_10032522 [Myotis brandtii]
MPTLDQPGSEDGWTPAQAGLPEPPRCPRILGCIKPSKNYNSQRAPLWPCHAVSCSS